MLTEDKEKKQRDTRCSVKKYSFAYERDSTQRHEATKYKGGSVRFLIFSIVFFVSLAFVLNLI